MTINYALYADIMRMIEEHEDILHYYPSKLDRLSASQQNQQLKILQCENQLKLLHSKMLEITNEYNICNTKYIYAQEWIQENALIIRKEKQKQIISLLSSPNELLLSLEKLDILANILKNS